MNGLEIYDRGRLDKIKQQLHDWPYSRSYWLVVYFSIVAILSSSSFVFLAMILSALDITLTHLQLYLEERKTGKWRLDKEMNVVPRWFMRRFGGHPNPKNYTLASLITVPLVGLVIATSIAIGTTDSLLGGGAIVGMLIIVNVYHIGFLTRDKK